MERQNVLNQTNEYGKQFVSHCLKNYEILGIERHKSSAERNEFDVIYKRTDNTVGVAVLPEKDSKNDGTCFFGDIKYYAIVYALEFAEIKIIWPPACTGNSYPVWPTWYEHDAEKLKIFNHAYNRIMQYEN